MIDVAVLGGGTSAEHEVSRRSAAEVIRHLDRSHWRVWPVLLDRTGGWRVAATPVPADASDAFANVGARLWPGVALARLLDECGIRIVFPVLHGRHGEDGTVQGMIDLHGDSLLEINNLDSLKDKRLMRALVPFVSDETWEASSSDETFYTHPGRTFRFHMKLEVALPNDSHARWLSTPRKHHDPLDADTALMRKFDVYISITAFVRSDSELCRYVTDVTEEVKRVETKRIVCA